MTRQEANLKLAEWSGWRFLVSREDEPAQWHHPDCSCVAMKPADPCACHDGCYWFDDSPDFFTSEEANALLLEKMPEPELWVESTKGNPKLWACQPDIMQEGPDHNPNYILAMNADRKAAIAEAAIRLIEKEAK